MMQILFAILFIVVQTAPLHAYIDPGTGSMLVSFLTGIMVTLFFLMKNLSIRIKTISFRKGERVEENRKNLVIYSEGKQYWNTFEPVLQELSKRGVPFWYYSSDPEDPGLSFTAPNSFTRYIGKGNVAWRILNLLEADTCLCTTPGLDVLQFKRSPKVKRYIHVLHAVTDATLYRLFGIDYFDSILLTGPYQQAQLRELEHKRGIKPRELCVCGCTYLDVLARKAISLSREPEPKTLLLAPSWGENGILRRFGLGLLRALAASSWHIIIRPHPQSRISEKDTIDMLMRELKDRTNIEWNFDTENLSAMARSRVLISDFSGILFDFSFLFGRPVVCPEYTFDTRPYDASDCREEAWTFITLRSLAVTMDESHLSDIDSFLETVESRKDQRTIIGKARGEAWAYPGESGKRVVDFMLTDFE